MNKLEDTDSGEYKIVTESGAEYEIDMDSRELVRVQAHAGTTPVDGIESVSMRRDQERVKLVRVVTAEIGVRGLFALDLDLPTVALTMRETTSIVSIERLAVEAIAAASEARV
jgi:hypothetical protein